MDAGHMHGDGSDLLLDVLEDTVPLPADLLAIVCTYDDDPDHGDTDDSDLVMGDSRSLLSSSQPDDDDMSVSGETTESEVDEAVELAGAAVGLVRGGNGGVLETLVFKGEVVDCLFKHDNLGRLSNRNSLLILRTATGDCRHSLNVLHRAGAGEVVWGLVGSFLNLPVVATINLTK
jgi:hypothetical protein